MHNKQHKTVGLIYNKLCIVHHHFICPLIQQYAHLHQYNFRRAGQQGQTKTLITAALKSVIKQLLGTCYNIAVFKNRVCIVLKSAVLASKRAFTFCARIATECNWTHICMSSVRCCLLCSNSITSICFRFVVPVVGVWSLDLRMGVRTQGQMGPADPPGNGWKIKKRKHAKRAIFNVYAIFWEQLGQAGVENGAMLTTYLFRYTSACIIS